MSGSRNQPQKRKGLTLDLNAATTKKPKTASHILTSPDVQMLKLTSPELAEFLTRNPTLATPTPSGNTILFPKTVTEEQELYAKGFEVALKNMHQGPGGSGGHIISTAHPPPPPLVQYKTEPAPSNASAIEAIERATAAHRAQSKMPIMATSEVLSPRPSSSASGSMDSTDQIRIKEELDDSDPETDDDEDYSEEEEIPSNQNNFRGAGAGRKSTNKRLGLMAPIDMKSQEKVKLERKRQRNRLAASKCRKRKLERISHLEGKVTGLKGENVELANVVKKLKESVYSLKQEVLEHHTNGCLISMQEIVYSTTAS